MRYINLFRSLFYLYLNSFFEIQSRVFWTWILQGLCEAIICTYLPILALNNSDPQNGMYETFWQGGGLTFTAVVIFTNVKVGFLLNQVHIGLVFAFAYSFGMWIMVAFVLATLILLDFEWFGVFQRLLLNGSFWMGLLFLVALHVVKDLYLAIIRFYGYPTNSQILREVSKRIFYLFSILSAVLTNTYVFVRTYNRSYWLTGWWIVGAALESRLSWATLCTQSTPTIPTKCYVISRPVSHDDSMCVPMGGGGCLALLGCFIFWTY